MLGVDGLLGSGATGEGPQGWTGANFSNNPIENPKEIIKNEIDQKKKIQAEELRHVWYEIFMFLKSANNLSNLQSNSDKDNLFIHDCLIECFLIHFRNILAFFRCKGFNSDEDEINYFLFTKKSITVEIDTQIKKRINTEIAHLSRIRTNNYNRKWNFGELTNTMKKHLQEFIGNIDRSRLPDNFIETLNNWRKITDIGINIDINTK